MRSIFLWDGSAAITMLDVNLPDIVTELTAAFADYERALIDNDIETLNKLFWNTEHTLRFGPQEHLYGHTAIAEFRKKRGPVDQRRMLRNTRITTFGRDFGIANTEYIPAGTDRVGRQSQTWMRTPDGWRIVCAHVSFAARTI